MVGSVASAVDTLHNHQAHSPTGPYEAGTVSLIHHLADLVVVEAGHSFVACHNPATVVDWAVGRRIVGAVVVEVAVAGDTAGSGFAVTGFVESRS